MNVIFLVITYLISIFLSFVGLYQAKRDKLPIKALSAAFAFFTITLISLVLIDLTYDLFSVDMIIFVYVFFEFLRARRWITTHNQFVEGFI
ncbi:MAG: hypothetical protein ACW99Q_18115 [Candidatus Kariarchaeaceae archaeon]